jgi:hypothetical protein
LDTSKSFSVDLYSVNEQNFDDIALQLFQFQAEKNFIYKKYIEGLGVNPHAVSALTEIPFLPISFFKTHSVKTGAWEPQRIFTSSGTSAKQTSSHPVRDLDFYLSHSVRCFEYFFNNIQDYHFLALLPSYLERRDSSLVAMMDHFIKVSGSPASGFYLHDTAKLLHDVAHLRSSTKKTVLWGVTFALLDIAERYHPDLSHCLVFETGGMKGRRHEMTRYELHESLGKAFKSERVYSEYGMTELLSQAYSRGENAFFCPPWMKIVGRDITDPLQKGLLNETAGINVIDFANRETIAFVETDDLGKVFPDGSFEIMGRIDNSDIRGCNLLVE